MFAARLTPLLTIVALTLATKCVFAQVHDTGTHRMFEMARPGVVLVAAEQSTKVTIPEGFIPEDKALYLRSKIRALVAAGKIPANDRAVLTAFVAELLRDPLLYLVPSEKEATYNAKTGGTGSGFIVSPNGYIVTNAHVAVPDEDLVKKLLIEQALADDIKADAKQNLEILTNILGGVPSTEVVNMMIEAEKKYDLRYMKLGTIERKATIFVGAARPGEVTGTTGIPAEITEAHGRSIPGKDVAILKIDRANLPTLPLGDDQLMNVGDRLFAIGYPAAATFHAILSSDTVTEPSLTAGLISAKKAMRDGWAILQTDAAIAHGNSGGPALDGNGQVIGITTFGTLDPQSQTNQLVAGFNFVVPISIVKEFLSRANVQPSEGVFVPIYRRALDAYDAQHFKRALDAFEQADRLSPGHPYVQRYIADSQAQISQGHDVPDVNWGLLAAAVTLAVVSLVASGYLLARRHTHRRTLA